ncbi:MULTISPECIES: hypothetical protein [unclassified Flavobacterium]|uniref:DUF350 domain-containing protein n=1 Tax=unclassified Flavobacterium TaxID=196869 RepID=UPI001F12916B|nr:MULTISPECIES: hypothetical protein [unclassified Flavobacterium]UMY64358.1 hypothetical protein MKO97_07505 [Flavobacterium sp. HJ-32-4]
MKTQSIIVTLITAIVSFILLLYLIQLLSRKYRDLLETEEGTRPAFTAHFTGLLVSGALLLAKVLPLVPEGFGVLWSQYNRSFVFETMQLIATLTGFTFFWIITLYFLNTALLGIILGKRNERIEMERNNTSFFWIKGTCLFGFSLVAASVLEPFLRQFLPELDVPLYF